MMKVAINVCFGGFSISPETALKLYQMGMTELAVSVDEYFGGKDYSKDLAKWREYQSTPTKKRDCLFLTVFTPDEKYILDTRPENRSDSRLIHVIEEMGEEANGALSQLRIVEIPDGIEYEIDEYDGNEHIAEKHRIWR